MCGTAERPGALTQVDGVNSCPHLKHASSDEVLNLSGPHLYNGDTNINIAVSLTCFPVLSTGAPPCQGPCGQTLLTFHGHPEYLCLFYTPFCNVVRFGLIYK